jgi:hypothetical protein
VPFHCEHRHVFLYLATRENPMAFRVFLLRHGDPLPHILEWTIRVVLPRRVRKAATLYRYALRDAFIERVMPSSQEELGLVLSSPPGRRRVPRAEPSVGPRHHRAHVWRGAVRCAVSSVAGTRGLRALACPVDASETMMPLCSALSMLSASASTARMPRGLRALTAPVRSG